MKVVRHGKPSKAFLATLRPPGVKDFDKLVESCMAAIISGHNDVIIRFPYTMKFPADFPRGICESKEPNGTNIHRVKAKRLLTWLHANGHTAATVEMLGVQKRLYAETEKHLNIIF